MSKAARVGDTGSAHDCFPQGPIISGSQDIFINGKPAARQGDSLQPHSCPCPQMPHGIHERTIAKGASTVFFNGKPAARTGDTINCGGTIESGSDNVFIGDTPWRSPLHDCIAKAASLGAPMLKISPMPEDPPPPPDAQMEVTGYAETTPEPDTPSTAPPDKEKLTKAEQERKKRYQTRKALADKAENIPALKESAQRLRFNNDNILYAEAADAVYAVDEHNRDSNAPYPDLPVGMEEVDVSQIPGIEKSDFTNKDSGFGATLFYSKINGKYILAYRGTRVNSLKDWKNNAEQNIGIEADQYKQAMTLAKKIKKSCTENPNIINGGFCSNLILVGHSLGGGLADAAVSVTGFMGRTFNAAGLNSSTVAREGGIPPEQLTSLVTNTYVQGEILTELQSGFPFMHEAVGKQTAVPNTAINVPDKESPSLYDKYISSPLKSIEDTLSKPIKGHFITTVINGIELQKQTDINRIIKTLKETP